MLPLYEEKCPCCDQINLIPISLTYSKDISNYMNIETFMKLNSIFKYIQIYSVDYDLTEYDLCFIAYIAHKFNLKSFKKYLESIKYVFYGIEIIEDLTIKINYTFDFYYTNCKMVYCNILFPALHFINLRTVLMSNL